jgi:hypothetical protein
MVRQNKRNKSQKNRRSQKSRKSQKRNQKNRRNRSQRGGSGCAALSMNRGFFGMHGGRRSQRRSQRGGSAALGSNTMLLDGPTRIQAQVGSLDSAMHELPSVIPRHQGGGAHHAFNGPSMLLPQGQNPGFNPQFTTEASVSRNFVTNGGAQH